jgi:plasmid stabilization system protein ParE
MMLNVYWSPHAKESYSAILDQLFQRYAADTILNIDDKVEALLENLSRNKFLCPKSSYFPEVRCCVINKNLSVAYRVSDNEIEIITFFDNRSEHGF